MILLGCNFLVLIIYVDYHEWYWEVEMDCFLTIGMYKNELDAEGIRNYQLLMLIAADTRSHALHSSYHACTSAVSCVGQVDRPNAIHVDYNPTMPYMWDLSVALGVPWESSTLAAVSTPNKTHTAQLLASVDSS